MVEVSPFRIFYFVLVFVSIVLNIISHSWVNLAIVVVSVVMVESFRKAYKL